MSDLTKAELEILLDEAADSLAADDVELARELLCVDDDAWDADDDDDADDPDDDDPDDEAD